MWELSSGELLLSILFDVEIMSVTSDPCEYFLFCGGSDGNIFQVSLCSQVSPTVLKVHYPRFNEKKNQFERIYPANKIRLCCITGLVLHFVFIIIEKHWEVFKISDCPPKSFTKYAGEKCSSLMQCSKSLGLNFCFKIRRNRACRRSLFLPH